METRSIPRTVAAWRAMPTLVHVCRQGTSSFGPWVERRQLKEARALPGRERGVSDEMPFTGEILGGIYRSDPCWFNQPINQMSGSVCCLL